MKKIPLKITFALLCLLAALASGCSSELKKPTEDASIASKALDLVDGLRTAYQTKQFSNMARFCTGDTYRNIAGNLKSFDSVELTFSTKRIEINRNADAVVMLVDWNGKWVAKDKPIEKKGTALFLLDGDPLKVRDIKRLSPFSQP